MNFKCLRFSLLLVLSIALALTSAMLQLVNCYPIVGQVYNNALLINADCRTKDALEYIRKEFQEFSTHRGSMAYDETDRWLDSLFTGTIYLFIIHCLL